MSLKAILQGQNDKSLKLDDSVLKQDNEDVTSQVKEIVKPTAEEIGAVSLSGGTMTGSLVLKGDPAEDLEAATKQYVDNNSGGITYDSATGKLMQSGADVTDQVSNCFISDETLTSLGLESDATIDNALASIGNLALAQGLTQITVIDEDGNPFPGVAIQGITAQDGSAVSTGVDGKALAVVTEATEVTFVSPYADIADVTQTILPNYTSMNTVNVQMPYDTCRVAIFSTSGTLTFKKARTVDISVVGGGQGGQGGGRGGRTSEYNGNSGSGGSGGKVLNVTGQTISAGEHELAVGAGGAGTSGGTSYSSDPSTGTAGGYTTFDSWSSNSGTITTIPVGDAVVGGNGGYGGRSGNDGSAGTRAGGKGGKGGVGGTNYTSGGAGSSGGPGGGGGGGGGGGKSGYTNLEGGYGGSGGSGGSGCLVILFN